MKTTVLGRSDLEVSRIAFGTRQLGGGRGAFDEDAAVASVGVFTGGAYRRNLAIVRVLETAAADRGISLSQLAIAWTLTNPAAMHVAIAGPSPEGMP
jgi:aryl-alcohol dehydrogenase-like predicted oxidoreductase